MKITYIGHSGFLVEGEECLLLFDYYKGELLENFPDKKLFVFVSHKHSDHFNYDIFQLTKKVSDVTYILSKDTKMSAAFRKKLGITDEVNIHYVVKNQSYTFPLTSETSQIKVETLESTDEGVAFIVTVNDKVLYHAGDLNWWAFPGEEEEYNQNMGEAYRKQINQIKGRHFDAAFVPLDPRQEEMYALGLDYFMRQTDTKAVFPMHYWEQPEIIEKLINSEISLPYRSKIKDLSRQHQSEC